jgi:hypothetical protein
MLMAAETLVMLPCRSLPSVTNWVLDLLGEEFPDRGQSELCSIASSSFYEPAIAV